MEGEILSGLKGTAFSSAAIPIARKTRINPTAPRAKATQETDRSEIPGNLFKQIPFASLFTTQKTLFAILQQNHRDILYSLIETPNVRIKNFPLIF
ncbi:MAG: hypothetical protein KC553_03275 [Nitrospina sp.]|nr:hypothetical protein [Nitrospina sp.]